MNYQLMIRWYPDGHVSGHGVSDIYGRTMVLAQFKKVLARTGGRADVWLMPV